MSKASTASAKTRTQLSSQSAWAKGPQPHSQPPAPHVSSPITVSHTRRPSALGQGVPIKEGVSVPRNNVSSVSQGSAAVTFGSIDETSPSLSSSPAATPVVKTESVKSFGSVPATPSTHVNGKFPVPVSTAGSSKLPARPASSSTSSVSSPSITSTTFLSATSASAKPTLNRVDIARLFQGSAAPQQPSSDTSSPSTQPSNLPLHHQPSASGHHTTPPPTQPSQLGVHKSAPSTPGVRPRQGAGGPCSPAFPRAVLNSTDTPSRPMAGSGGPSDPPTPASPRLAPHPSHPHQPPTPAQQVPMEPTPWAPYYYPIDAYGQPVSWFYHPMHHKLQTPTPVSQGPPHPATLLSPRNPTLSPDLVESKVRALLNKLTPEKFDTISDNVIAWANKSENERDAKTLNQVIKIVFEQVTHGPACIEIYARLCRKMMERISPEVQHDSIRNMEGKPIAGGQLFRKYLLNRCQEDFERGWVAEDATGLNEHYGAQGARCYRLGLIKFIGELFKLQMLTERIMHECVKKHLRNVENPEEEEIESLCQLLKTVGQQLDVPKSRAHMDVYFTRMKELCKSLNVSPRMQFMLQDVIELRDRKWVARGVVVVPTTLSAVHEAAAKQKANAEARRYQRYTAGGSVARPYPKAGDLSQFGKISKGMPIVGGPSSVFTKKDLSTKRGSLSQIISSPDMFCLLNQSPELVVNTIAKSSQRLSWNSSIDFGQGGALEPVHRKKLRLLPRKKPIVAEETSPLVSENDTETPVEMLEADMKRRIDEDVKEFFAIRNMEEADVYFSNLPEEHRFRLVDKLVGSALESKEADTVLVSKFFAQASSRGQCSFEVFEAGFMPMAEFLDDIAIDAPNAFKFMAIMLKGAGFDQDDERLARIAAKSMDGDKLLQLVAS